jgi:hypothetical protein
MSALEPFARGNNHLWYCWDVAAPSSSAVLPLIVAKSAATGDGDGPIATSRRSSLQLLEESGRGFRFCNNRSTSPKHSHSHLPILFTRSPCRDNSSNWMKLEPRSAVILHHFYGILQPQAFGPPSLLGGVKSRPATVRR